MEPIACSRFFNKRSERIPGSRLIPSQLRWGNDLVPRFNYFAREAAATLLRMAKTTTDPAVASGLIQRAADLKERTEELPAVPEVDTMAEQSPKALTKKQS